MVVMRNEIPPCVGLWHCQ